MDILIVDPTGAIPRAADPVFGARGWRSEATTDRAKVVAMAMGTPPDAIVIQSDGRAGETMHLCQRLKQNALTASIPLVVVENEPPPAWLLSGIPADAFAQMPVEPDELIHHIEALAQAPAATGVLDDLTNCPRRRSILVELERRMVARDLFAAGVLAVREASSYRQDHGQAGLDQFVVLVSVLLRRHASAATPVSVGYLDDGVFLLLGAPSSVHHLIAQSIRGFEGLIPAYQEMESFLDSHGAHAHTDPLSQVSLEGGTCLVEPGRYDNAQQIGFVLSETLTRGKMSILLSSGATGDPKPGGAAIAA